MILHHLLGGEQHRIYADLSRSNLSRQYRFLKSAVAAAINVKRPLVSATLVKALNYHAIACLHPNAGEYRPCPVKAGSYEPPEHFHVPEMMNDFINVTNRNWDACDTHTLAAYCLWRLNFIHPFINGNGRTARALCYFVVCVKSGGLIQGEPILPTLIRERHEEYRKLLRSTDREAENGNPDYLNGLRDFVARLVERQLRSAT